MQGVRKRIEALEKSLAVKTEVEVLIVRRDPVTGQWRGAPEISSDPVRRIVPFYSDVSPDPALATQDH